MATAKDIRIAPISSKDANAIVDRLHYSHTHVNNSMLHMGVFLSGRIEGVMSFGPPMKKISLISLVRGTAWNGFLELNRMAFSEVLPRNSESRALSVAFRLIRKRYPHIEWIVSFADGQQCGDGTIYRAAGGVLTGYSSGAMWRLPAHLVPLNGGKPVAHAMVFRRADTTLGGYLNNFRHGKYLKIDEYPKYFGGEMLCGYNFRYMFFLNPEARSRLTVPVLPFSTIDRLGGRMYRGKKINADEAGNGGDQPHSGSAALTRPLHMP